MIFKGLSLTVLTFLFFISSCLFGLTISHSAEEVTYEYSASFRTLKPVSSLSAAQLKKQAEFHAGHLFGLFHSPEVAEIHGFPAELIEGFAGSKVPKVEGVESFEQDGDPYIWVSYRGTGTFLLHRNVLKSWLGDKKTGSVKLPLLEDFPAIYQDDMKRYREAKWKKCTDSHYWKPEDFSYFYNPYRCPELGKAPLAKETTFKLSRLHSQASLESANVPLAELQGSNGNGRLMTLYFVNGFDGAPEPGAEPKQIHRDEGWKNFKMVESLLVKRYGFEKVESLAGLREILGKDLEKLTLQMPVHLIQDMQRRYFSTFIKVEPTRVLVARSALFNTENEVRSHPLRSFPLFWKEAWENGDVIYFGGHSGDGQALSLKNILSTLEKADYDAIQFKGQRTQIALLDSCSSYAHYQDLYFNRKPARMHLITMGLVSLFYFARNTVDELIQLALRDPGKPLSWDEAIGQFEKSLLTPHVDAMFDEPEREKAFSYFKNRRLYPTSLMSVRVPE